MYTRYTALRLMGREVTSKRMRVMKFTLKESFDIYELMNRELYSYLSKQVSAAITKKKIYYIFFRHLKWLTSPSNVCNTFCQRKEKTDYLPSKLFNIRLAARRRKKIHFIRNVPSCLRVILYSLLFLSLVLRTFVYFFFCFQGTHLSGPVNLQHPPPLLHITPARYSVQPTSHIN